MSLYNLGLQCDQRENNCAFFQGSGSEPAMQEKPSYHKILLDGQLRWLYLFSLLFPFSSPNAIRIFWKHTSKVKHLLPLHHSSLQHKCPSLMQVPLLFVSSATGIHSVVHLVNKYLLSAHCVIVTFLGTGDVCELKQFSQCTTLKFYAHVYVFPTRLYLPEKKELCLISSNPHEVAQRLTHSGWSIKVY